MGKKWEKFHSTHSDLKINNPNLASSNITADWFRAAESKPCKVYIDGKPLSHYVNSGALATEAEVITNENLKDFFQKVILGKLSPSAKKVEMVEYLMHAFHQGGLLYPVTGGINSELVKVAFEEQLNNAANIFYNCAKQLPDTKDDIFVKLSLPKDGDLTKDTIKASILNQLGTEQTLTNLMSFMTRSDKELKINQVSLAQQFNNKPSKVPTNNEFGTVNIVTTKTGFKCQEFVDLPSMLLPNGTRMEGKDKPYVLKAQGTINVDFSKFEGIDKKPMICIDSNTISFGNPEIKNMLDKRDWLKIFLDFLKSIANINAVRTIAPEKPVQAIDEKNITDFMFNKP